MTHQFEMTVTPTHAYAEYNSGPWGPFPFIVEHACSPYEEGCKTLSEPEFSHSFTFCNSTLMPTLDFKEVIPFYNFAYPPEAGKVICI